MACRGLQAMEVDQGDAALHVELAPTPAHAAAAPRRAVAPGAADAAVAAQLKESVLEDLASELAKAGGPSQYLEQVDLVEFGHWLWQSFPEDDAALYTHSKGLPAIAESEASTTPPLLCHVAALGFSELCSLKPPPGRAQCLALCEQYLLDGFLTSTNESGPLLVLEGLGVATKALPEDLWHTQCRDAMSAFSLGYLKGMARSCSLLFLLHRLMVTQVPVERELRALYATVRQVHVHHIRLASRMDEALTNMRISCRSSLRKATTTLQSVVMVRNLVQMGTVNDYMAFVRSWNSMSAKQFRFAGRRLSAMRLLFEEAPQDTSRGM